MLRVFDIQMTGQHIGQPADLTSAHRIRLASDRKRPHADLPNASRCKVTIQDRIDLVAARRGLINALTKDRDNAFRTDPKVAELFQFGLG